MNSFHDPFCIPQVPDNWYETFFTPEINTFWSTLTPDEVTRKEVNFIEQQLQLPGSAKILDIPCGSGRHSLELARRGHQVTGVDISADAITRARNSALVENLRINFILHDMKDLVAADLYDGALCFGNSFG